MPDETIRCGDCHRDFTYSVKEQQFYQEKGFSAPRRCKECRQAKKEQGGGSSRGRGEYRGNRW